jgi:urease subunit alpha
LGVIGESGSGKSTFLKTLCGLLAPTAGALRMAGTIDLGGTNDRLIDAAQPRQIAAQFGGIGGAAVDSAVIFTNSGAVGAGADVFPTRRRRVAVKNCRDVGLGNMIRHRSSSSVVVSPDGSRVTLDGQPLAMDPVDRVPLSRLYFL